MVADMNDCRTTSGPDHATRISARAALVLAVIAVVAALGGTAWAAATITSASIKDGAVQSRDIANGRLGVAGVDVRDGSLGVVDLSVAARRALRGVSGPAGPAGPAGAAGATGPVGPAGPGATRIAVTIPMASAAGVTTRSLASVGGVELVLSCEVTGSNVVIAALGANGALLSSSRFLSRSGTGGATQTSGTGGTATSVQLVGEQALLAETFHGSVDAWVTTASATLHVDAHVITKGHAVGRSCDVVGSVTPAS